MDPFEFVLVLVSIILGLALADLLSTLAKVLRSEVEAGILHSLWMLWVGVILLQQFWSRWSQVGRPDWSTIDVTVFILPALLGFLAAALLAPSSQASGKRMDDDFVDRRVPFLVVNILLMASYSLEDWVLMGRGTPWIDLLRGGIVALFIVAIVVRRRSVQVACVVIPTAIAIIFSLFWTSSLSVNASLAG